MKSSSLKSQHGVSGSVAARYSVHIGFRTKAIVQSHDYVQVSAAENASNSIP